MTMNTNTMHAPNSAVAPTVAAWDLPTRLFHWTLLATILSAWPSFELAERLGDPTLKWHRYNGLAILTLVVFRLIWGFVGSSTSRWSAFVTWPWHVARYAVDQVSGVGRHYLGHNPLGTYMILALLLAVSGQAMLGLLVTEHNDTTWGPLYNLVPDAWQKTVRHWHGLGLYRVILPLALAHVVANSLYGLVKREPLVRAMVTGRKPAADYADGREAFIGRNVGLKAIGALLLAVAIVAGAIKALGGAIFY